MKFLNNRKNNGNTPGIEMRNYLKRIRWISAIAIMSLVLISASIHKFYVSKTTIVFNDRTRIFEVTTKFFTDDLEKVLMNGSDKSLHLGQENESIETDPLIEKYVMDHLKININDESIAMRYVGKEVDSDLTHCYFEFFRTPQFITMKVENSLLIDVFPDQQNIVDLRMNSSTKTIILLRDKTVDTFFQ